jgi:hypothetical protein
MSVGEPINNVVTASPLCCAQENKTYFELMK